MRRLPMVLALCLVVLLMPSGSALACQIIPWQLDAAVQSAEAMLVGKIMTTTNNGRQANLQVLAYAGKGVAPQRLALPSTESGASRQFDCPDTSTQFVAGRTYLIFLRQGMPGPQLLNTNTPTAAVMDEAGLVPTEQPAPPENAANVPAAVALQGFAQARGLKVQGPGSGSGARRALVAGAVAVVVLAGMVTLWRRRVAKPGARV